MGTGWRKAFCTTIPRDREATIADKQQQQSPGPSPKRCAKLGFLSGGSNPSTPRGLQSQTAGTTAPSLRCRTNSTTTVPSVQTSSTNDTLITPKLQCKTTTTTNTPKSTTKTPRTLLGSNPSSPRSPFSIFKNSLRLSRNSCGVCSQSVRRGQGMAIYTAECSHAFHFPCIAAHVRKQSNLVCPVCNSTWNDEPLLAIHEIQQPEIPDDESEVNKNQEFINSKAKHEEQVSKLSEVRIYDDDEPLLSPTTGGGRFIPIPEADENEEVDNEPDEIEEFQGFFVNPISSSTGDESVMNGRDLRNVEVKVMPEAAVVSVGRTHEAYAVVLKVKAPPPPPPAHNSSTANFLDPSRRAPIDLVTVLDVSGSMSGAKLQMLKRAMRLVISSLGSADRLSIVAFSASPKRLLPLRRMTIHGQRAARRIIDRLVCSQGTSVGDALRKATKVLEDRRERNPVASIMLLSDGQDERVQPKNSDRRQTSSHVSSTRFAHIEIPVHAFGFGERSGGYSHETAEDAFTKCVGGLLCVVAQDLRIQLGLVSGSAPAEISAVYSCNGRPTVLSSGSVRLGDLSAEEERELLVELRVPTSAVGAHHVLSVRCCYKDPATQVVVYGREQALVVPRPQAVRSSAPEIERLRNLFITTRAIAESRRLIEHNELSSADHLLSSTRALLMQSSSISADEYIRGLEVELHWHRQNQQRQQVMQRRRGNEREMALVDENGEPLTPTSAWRAAERLAKVAMMRKSLNRVSDLHGFENARF
uniref:RING-type E3 ubiquitin transferase n=1 Tax=Davidia involucrata TaxID=16924 RepID=A0A5B7B4Y3_DAVIN